MKFSKHFWLAGLCALGMGWALSARAADSFSWDAGHSRITAEVGSWPLTKLLEKVADNTGWQIYVEPGTAFTVSAKFNNLPVGEGLRALLGDLSFALVPQTNAPATLYVFHTSQKAATQLVKSKLVSRPRPGAKSIPNQLIVTIKPGASIDVIARAVGAKVVGRVDGLNTYLLQFDSADAAEAALAYFNSDPDVVSVDHNYEVPKPSPQSMFSVSGTGELPMQAKAIGADGKITVGLVDDMGGDPNSYCGLSDFLLPTVNVAGSRAAAGNSPSHGYSMAATIVRGVAAVNGSGNGKPFRIQPYDVFGTNAMTTSFAVASGIYNAVNAGANPINLSLGSPDDSGFLQSVITRAEAQGVVFFAAAGNEPVATPTYPAAYPGVIAVTAGDQQGVIASYANYGSFVDAVGPSGNVVCYNGQAWYVKGTSTATAFASGLDVGASALGQSSSQAIATVTNALPVSR